MCVCTGQGKSFRDYTKDTWKTEKHGGWRKWLQCHSRCADLDGTACAGTHFCRTCNKLLCEHCTTAHKKQRHTKGHSVRRVSGWGMMGGPGHVGHEEEERKKRERERERELEKAKELEALEKEKLEKDEKERGERERDQENKEERARLTERKANEKQEQGRNLGRGRKFERGPRARFQSFTAGARRGYVTGQRFNHHFDPTGFVPAAHWQGRVRGRGRGSFKLIPTQRPLGVAFAAVINQTSPQNACALPQSTLDAAGRTSPRSAVQDS